MLDAISTTLETRLCSFQELPKDRCAAAVMGRAGDVKIIWDRQKTEEVEQARLMFDGLRKKNYLAFKVTDEAGTKGEQVREFDPKIERMVFTPQMQAG